MIIKSHVRGGFTAAAKYMKAKGENELTRLVQISDPDAKDINDAFHNMWALASNTKAKKPLHHISINPFKDERLTDDQVLKIVERCEQKYGYKPDDHQRVIVEHVKDGRQHFHVMWNRVSLTTGKAVWPGQHWNKSKQAAREMERELGLKRPEPKVRRYSGGHATGSRSAFCLPPMSSPFGLLPPPRLRPQQPEQQPTRPMDYHPQTEGILSGMSEAQRIDFIAACEGRITWRAYFDRWGMATLSL